MSKFKLLIVLIVACIALSTATWTITGPTTAIHIGSLFSLEFISDEALISGTPTNFKLGFPFLSDIAVSPAGGRLWCTDPGTKKQNLAYWSLSGSDFAIFPLADTSAPITLSCLVRMHPSPNGSGYTVAPPSDLGETLTLAGISSVAWKFGMESNAGSLKVNVANVPPYTLIGPINHFLSYSSGGERNVNSFLSPQIYNNDFNSRLGSDMRLLATSPTTLYLITDEDPTSSASYKLDYPTVGQAFDYDDANSYGKKYSYRISAPLAGGKSIEDMNEVGVVEMPNDLGFASISMTAVPDATNYLVIYQFNQIFADVNDPVVKFSFDGFSKTDVFNNEPTLEYKANDADTWTTVTTMPNSLELTLTGVPAGKFATMRGTFLSSQLKSCGVSFSSEISSGSDEFGPFINIQDLSITAASNDAIFFNFKVTAGNNWEKYTDSIRFSRDFSLSWNSLSGEFRAKGKFTPECTSENLSVSLSNNVGASIDPNQLTLSLSGTLSTGASVYDVSCKQLVNDRKKNTDNVNVSIGGNDVNASTGFTATWDVADTIPDLNQQIIVRGASIDGTGDQKDVLAAVITAINQIPSLSGVSTSSLYFKSDSTQHYGDYDNGWELKFSNNIAYYSNSGAFLTLVCARTADSDPVNQLIVLQDFQISISGGSFTGAPIAPVYLDGESSDYRDTPRVMLGFGVDCWSTKQCGGGYCYRNTCTPIPLLSRSAQARAGLVSGNDAIAAWTTCAIVIAFVALLF